jgi:protein-S-isoprenylcysteine O-methyltransferase Ste14
VVLSGLVHLLVVFYEEPRLRKEFGETYEEYTMVTQRWIPRIPRRPERNTRE